MATKCGQGGPPLQTRTLLVGNWLVHALDYASLAALDRLLQRKYTK